MKKVRSLINKSLAISVVMLFAFQALAQMDMEVSKCEGVPPNPLKKVSVRIIEMGDYNVVETVTAAGKLEVNIIFNKDLHSSKSKNKGSGKALEIEAPPAQNNW